MDSISGTTTDTRPLEERPTAESGAAPDGIDRGAGPADEETGDGLAGLTPRQIVAELDQYIIGQRQAKRAVAIALRNRWRRQNVESEMREEILPNNIIMIGPTGVGKTEIARRLARLAGAPFIKVEASKFTEVGYVGRDVESMVRDLVEISINMVRSEKEEGFREAAEARVEDRLLDLLLPPVAEKPPPGGAGLEGARPGAGAPGRGAPGGVAGVGAPGGSGGPAAPGAPGLRGWPGAEGAAGEAGREGAAGEAGAEGPVDPDPASAADVSPGGARTFIVSREGQAQEERAEAPEARKRRTRDKLRQLLRDGRLEERQVEVEVTESSMPLLNLDAPGMEGLDWNMSEMLQGLLPKKTRRREVTVAEARRILLGEELDRLVDMDEVIDDALDRVENMGIIFLDELDKVAGQRGGGGPDVSREGVQRDLLPIVEGSTVQTRYGMVNTDHILFIAAGAFHVSKPSDLIPELQGRFPIRVELRSLDEADFVRILSEPRNALLSQYRALVETEGAVLEFTDEAIRELARIASEVNQRMENIGARRLHTVLTTLLDEVMFDLPDAGAGETIRIDADFVRDRLSEIAGDEDLRRYIL